MGCGDMIVVQVGQLLTHQPQKFAADHQPPCVCGTDVIDDHSHICPAKDVTAWAPANGRTDKIEVDEIRENQSTNF